MSQLAENIISQLCVYLGAEAGALFLLNGKILSLAGRYAFADRAGFDGQLQLDDGLVGQAAADGKPLILDHMDLSPRIISTGLVEIKPRNVLAFPFYANNKVVGVIEMASLAEFTQNQVELLNRLSETIGIGFLTMQTHEKLKNLLSESQQQ